MVVAKAQRIGGITSEKFVKRSVWTKNDILRCNSIYVMSLAEEFMKVSEEDRTDRKRKSGRELNFRSQGTREFKDP